MIWICVLSIVLLILLIVLFIPFNIIIKYVDKLSVEVSIAGIKIKRRKIKSKTNYKSSSVSNSNFKNDFFDVLKKRGFVKSFKMFYDILNASRDVFIKLMKNIIINNLKLVVKVGSTSSALTAIRYGQVSSVVYPTVSLISAVCSPKELLLQVFPDFNGEKITSELEISISGNVFRMIPVLFLTVKKYKEFV